jgi:predicted transcriptional regulator of viral defense system
MSLRELISAMNRWDDAGIWAYSLNTLKLMFPEDLATLKKSLGRHVKDHLIERVARGLYVNPRARSFPPDVLSALVPFLRPWEFNYLSLESALSETGRISQIPSRMTLMTTGRSQTFATPFGTLEFIHTAQTGDQLRGEMIFDETRALDVASPARALRDLRRVGRNLDLVVNLESPDATQPE